MPSPIGHMLAGVGVAWTAEAASRQAVRPRTLLTCALLAALPDADLLGPGMHRTVSHSLTAVLAVFIVAAAVTGQVTRWRMATLCALAYASHLLLDWLGVDNFPPRGIQLLWPFSDGWYISNLDLFRQTARHYLWTAPVIRINLLAIAQEIAIMLPILFALWLVARRRRASEPSLVQRARHETATR
jgi:inner membrane protein